MATVHSPRKRAASTRGATALAVKPSTPPHTRLDAPELYLNPHVSLLAFQKRVLEEARDPATPLLERVKFLSILASNIDE
jgi:polyphosphate kinase